MKLKTVYICESCKHESPKWLGKCPDCNGWNTFTEDIVNTGKDEVTLDKMACKTPSVKISTKERVKGRISTGFSEVDNVLGGGFIIGSVVLLGGEPGIGKSTLTLQIVDNVDGSILYVSGEESADQINGRAKRLGLKLHDLSFLETSSLEDILATLNKERPNFVVVDSIQVISSELSSGYSGSISQVRYCTEALMHFAKANDITVLIIGHVNKDGNLAGPKTLEHLVDCVCMIEGDRYKDLRLLRSIKNRFGSTNEVGIFQMEGDGMREVKNPSEHILQDRNSDSIGSCLSVIVEGSRPIIIEVQALTSVTSFGYPKRAVSGYDANRLMMITAVLQKYADINLMNQDIYINVVGGMRVNDPAVDLAAALAIISSFKKKPLPDNAVALGEIGLSGEVRNVMQLERRENECKKLQLSILGPHKTIRETLTLFS